MSPVPLKKDWVLNQEAFDALLRVLDGDGDRDRAGERYEHIRRALITFFECRGSTTPDDLADDTITRVARRLLEGRVIEVENPASYFYGVARNVLREHWDARRRDPAVLEGQRPAAFAAADPQVVMDERLERLWREQRLDCLERCVGELPTNERELIRQYYQGEAGIKIDNRRRLAARLGIPINALRIRALRVRERLEACVERCMSERDAPETP